MVDGIQTHQEMQPSETAVRGPLQKKKHIPGFVTWWWRLSTESRKKGNLKQGINEPVSSEARSWMEPVGVPY